MRPSSPTLLLALATALPAGAGSHYQVLDHPQDSLYFGRVVHCDVRGDDLEAARVVRDGQSEPATVNTPLAPGDRLASPAERRCEVEFDTGTVAFLEGGTTLRLETVMAPSLSSAKRITNLVLESGRIRVRYRPYGSAEVFQVITKNAAVKVEAGALLDVAGEAAPGGTRVAVDEGQVTVLFGPDEARTKQRRLRAGEATSVRADHSQGAGRARLDVAGDTFREWSRERQGARSQGTSDTRPLPATLKNLPPAVLDFAERVSRAHGQWVWTRAKAHGWRPHESRKPGWRPHTDGRWTAVQGMPFWVPEEEWGWVPYHLGYWLDDADAGWVWLPGSTFAPAWVTWTGCGDSFAWWPFGPQDWLRYERSVHPYLPFCDASSAAWYSYPWTLDQPTTPQRPQEYAKRRSGTGPVPDPPPHRPRPEREGPSRELRTMRAELDRLAKRLPPEAAGAAERRAVPLQTRPEPIARREAARSPDAETTDEVPSRTVAAPVEATASAPAIPWLAEVRFRDWNPDVRAARNLGGRIGYDSAQNRVYCEGCRAVGAGSFLGAGDGAASGSNGVDSASGQGASGSGGPATGAPAGAGAGGAKAGPIDR